MNIQRIAHFVQKGNVKNTRALVKQALAENISIETVLADGLIAGIEKVGEKYKNHQIYVPEMLLAARAMIAGMQVLETFFSQGDNKPIGSCIIGTVQGDLHDIGKNLVKMMFQGAGITVYDLGIDVPPEEFIKKTRETNVDIICMTALLTTTMASIAETIKAFEENGLRDKYVFMIGGAPVTSHYARQIGADFYCPDASTAAKIAKEILLAKNSQGATIDAVDICS